MSLATFSTHVLAALGRMVVLSNGQVAKICDATIAFSVDPETKVPRFAAQLIAQTADNGRLFRWFDWAPAEHRLADAFDYLSNRVREAGGGEFAEISADEKVAANCGVEAWKRESAPELALS